MKKWCQLLVSMVVLVLADQLTKLWATVSLAGGPGIAVIPGVFEFQYVENRGAAFGILQNRQWLFIVGTVVMMVIIAMIYHKIPMEKRYRGLRISCILILSGAVGNFIDRVRQQYVVDFLYCKLIHFPVFNVADCFVVIGTILLVLIFFIKKDMMDELTLKEER